MNIHIPDELRLKYPNMEFVGKRKNRNGRTIIRARNHATGLNYYYSFEEDFFWSVNSKMSDKLINYPSISDTDYK
jgi:hypothetical protein